MSNLSEQLRAVFNTSQETHLKKHIQSYYHEVSEKLSDVVGRANYERYVNEGSNLVMADVCQILQAGVSKKETIEMSSATRSLYRYAKQIASGSRYQFEVDQVFGCEEVKMVCQNILCFESGCNYLDDVIKAEFPKCNQMYHLIKSLSGAAPQQSQLKLPGLLFSLLLLANDLEKRVWLNKQQKEAVDFSVNIIREKQKVLSEHVKKNQQRETEQVQHRKMSQDQPSQSTRLWNGVLNVFSKRAPRLGTQEQPSGLSMDGLIKEGQSYEHSDAVATVLNDDFDKLLNRFKGMQQRYKSIEASAKVCVTLGAITTAACIIQKCNEMKSIWFYGVPILIATCMFKAKPKRSYAVSDEHAQSRERVQRILAKMEKDLSPPRRQCTIS